MECRCKMWFIHSEEAVTSLLHYFISTCLSHDDLRGWFCVTPPQFRVGKAYSHYHCWCLSCSLFWHFDGIRSKQCGARSDCLIWSSLARVQIVGSNAQYRDQVKTADPGVPSSIPARSHTFVEIDHEIISTVILLPSAESFKKGCCQLQAKVCARSTG